MSNTELTQLELPALVELIGSLIKQNGHYYRVVSLDGAKVYGRRVA